MKSVIVFVVGGAFLGAVSLGIGCWLAGDDALLQGGIAFGLTFVPAAATLAWVVFSYRATPEVQLLASLGGNLVRMGVAAGGGIFLTQARPQTFDTTLWFWLLPFYFSFLTFEMTLVVLQQPKDERVGADVTK